jgi:hypothetical protein
MVSSFMWEALSFMFPFICNLSSIEVVFSSSSKTTGYIGIYTDKKENKIFLIFQEIQKGAVAKSYLTNGLLIYD